MSIKLIIALDFPEMKPVLALIDQLDPSICALKVGCEMFTKFGIPLIKSLIKKGFKLFLDLKFHDIPNTVAKSCKICADLGVWMLNVHALGGFEMMHAAKVAVESYNNDAPILIAVTILTSLNDNDLTATGISLNLQEEVRTLALLAKNAGLDGVVCSAHEVQAIKESCGKKFITVTPGIRTSSSEHHDQRRIMTPKQALSEGSDYLVIGRSITQSLNPAAKIKEILNDCQSYL